MQRSRSNYPSRPFCCLMSSLAWLVGCIAVNPLSVFIWRSQKIVLRLCHKMNLQSLLIFSYFLYSLQLNVLTRGKLKQTTFGLFMCASRATIVHLIIVFIYYRSYFFLFLFKIRLQKFINVIFISAIKVDPRDIINCYQTCENVRACKH